MSLKERIEGLPIIGTPFNLSEVTKETELDNGLTLKEYKGESASEKMAEIDLNEMEIRMIDTSWLKNDMLAHELAHYERFKEGNLINVLSGNFGNFVVYGGLFAIITLIVDKFSLFLNSYVNYIMWPLVGVIFLIPFLSKAIEEHQAENMKEEMKEKYNLEGESNGI